MKTIRREGNGSDTLTGLRDGTGAERQMNIHGYHVAASGEPLLTIAILDKKGIFLASVVLDEVTVRHLVGQILNMI